ncbi:hypothetical protein V6N13_099301 [Hibiscus sabdariffa]
MNKEEINGASSNQSIGENDAREQRSPRLSVILGDCYEEFPGIDNIEKSQNPTPGVMEFGTNPFGMQIDSIPTFEAVEEVGATVDNSIPIYDPLPTVEGSQEEVHDDQAGGNGGGWTVAAGSPAKESRGRLRSLMHGPSLISTRGNIRSKEVKRSLMVIFDLGYWIISNSTVAILLDIR